MLNIIIEYEIYKWYNKYKYLNKLQYVEKYYVIKYELF